MLSFIANSRGLHPFDQSEAKSRGQHIQIYRCIHTDRDLEFMTTAARTKVVKIILSQLDFIFYMKGKVSKTTQNQNFGSQQKR